MTITAKKKTASATGQRGAISETFVKGVLEEMIMGGGGPRSSAESYGVATARTHQVCASVARLGFQPTLPLADIDAKQQSLQSLITDMARISGPHRPGLVTDGTASSAKPQRACARG